MRVDYYNKEIETMPHEKLRGLQFKRAVESIGYALQTPFYQKRLGSVGIESPQDIQSWGDFKKIPYTTKDDLRDAYPEGMLAVERENVVRLHASSGTTGTPTVVYHTLDDIRVWTNLTARSIICTGAGKNDVFQNMMTYGLFTGGLGLHYGAEQVGMLVIPASSGNTKRQFKLMKDFQTTVVHATPSYLLHIYAKMEEEGITLTELALERAFVGAEPHSEDTRKKIEALFRIHVYNSYGLSEMNGPGVAFECQYKDGMHVWEDAYVMEIIDRNTLKTLDDGKEGELVFTTLQRQATPLLRYRTRDLTYVHLGQCGCGRTHRRIGRIKGRTDDMLIINGVNVFPSQIEEVIMRMPEIGTNYQIVIEKAGALDRLTVKTEVGQSIFSDYARDMNALRNRIKEHLQATISISPRVELHEPGILPVYEGKAKRVFDQREK